MKTPIQELIEQLKEERDGFLELPILCSIQERTENCFGSCIEIAERMLEKEKEVKPKYFERNQARIVFYAIQMAIDSGAKYIYMTDADEIIAFKEPMKPREIELSKSELVLTL